MIFSFHVLQVLIQLEQEQLITVDARRHAEQDAAEERNSVIVLQVLICS